MGIWVYVSAAICLFVCADLLCVGLAEELEIVDMAQIGNIQGGESACFGKELHSFSMPGDQSVRRDVAMVFFLARAFIVGRLFVGWTLRVFTMSVDVDDDLKHYPPGRAAVTSSVAKWPYGGCVARCVLTQFESSEALQRLVPILRD